MNFFPEDAPIKPVLKPKHRNTKRKREEDMVC